jgi:predicted nucleotide-binding protein (sugar kinase/HSP70/actin superfamily)
MADNLRVGIPRGLFWYYNPDSYKVFWETLGFEVIQSPPTNRRIFEDGLRLAHDELCLPVKIFHGHISYLKDKVDFIFIPRIYKMIDMNEDRFGCPKFIGLPELIKNSVIEIPPIISIDIDLTKGSLEDSFMSLHKSLGVNRNEIKHAFKEMKNFEEKNKPYNKNKNKKEDLKIGVVGHPYILYDSYISLNLLDKLSSLGVDYTTSAELSEDVVKSELYPDIDLFWIYERELIGAASFFLNHEDYDGCLHCVSFGCGPGSVMMEIIQRRIVKDNNLPLFTLVMDENTGEAGLITRLEAFCDMVRIKKR